MKKRWLLMLLLLGCSPETKNLYDMPAINNPAVVHFHEFKTKARLAQVIGEERLAMAVWSPQDSRCDVYFLAGDFTSLGHEVYHCFKGAFHEE